MSRETEDNRKYMGKVFFPNPVSPYILKGLLDTFDGIYTCPVSGRNLDNVKIIPTPKGITVEVWE